MPQKTATNYAAWGIDFNEYQTLTSDRQRYEFLLQFAILAASSHNTQPWIFQIHENTIDMLPDLTRQLPESDPHGREIYISLGCALANLLQASASYGLPTAYEIAADNSQTRARVKIGQTETVTSPDIDRLQLLLARATNRSAHLDKPVPAALLDKFKNLGSAGAAVSFVSDAARLAQLRPFVIRCFTRFFQDKKFRQELGHWVRNNKTRSFDGIPLFGMGIPTPLSFVLPHLLKLVDTSPSMLASLKKLIESTAAFGAISSSDDPENWIETGRVFQAMALEAQAAGLVIHPLTAAVESDEDAGEVQKLFSTIQRPQFFFRLGYPSLQVRHSPRRRLSDFFTIS